MDKLARFRKLDGNTLKIIACVTMLIDHIGAAILLPLTKEGIIPTKMPFETFNFIYDAIRAIGRTSFPIFVFLIAEGFRHTSSRLRYALSLLVFAFISELPFDYAFYGEIRYDRNNAIITLFLALITLWGSDTITKYGRKLKVSQYASLAAIMLLTFTTSCIASLLHCDYKYYGILLAMIFYFLRPMFPINILAAYLLIVSHSTTEFMSFPAFILIYLYNQKQGKKLGRYKYLFYAFYPVHLIILYIIRMCIQK
ncbi:MAG: conjugal transfer protein TraX [Butyrivibrio sp.]|nr:conjugal transfer protein TraX [Butyrivibrio sp.]